MRSANLNPVSFLELPCKVPFWSYFLYVTSSRSLFTVHIIVCFNNADRSHWFDAVWSIYDRSRSTGLNMCWCMQQFFKFLFLFFFIQEFLILVYVAALRLSCLCHFGVRFRSLMNWFVPTGELPDWASLKQVLIAISKVNNEVLVVGDVDESPFSVFFGEIDSSR